MSGRMWLPDNDGRGYLQGSTMTLHAEFVHKATGERYDPPTLTFVLIYRDETVTAYRYDNEPSGSTVQDPHVIKTGIGLYEADFPLTVHGRAVAGVVANGEVVEEHTITVHRSRIYNG